MICKAVTTLHGYDIDCRADTLRSDPSIPLYMVFVVVLLILLHHIFVHHARNIVYRRNRNEIYDPASANEYIPLV